MSPGDHPHGRSERAAHQLPDASCLLIEPATGRGLGLTGLGVLVWDSCDGALSRERIADEVMALEPQAPAMRHSVYEILEAFTKQGLLVHGDDITT